MKAQTKPVSIIAPAVYDQIAAVEAIALDDEKWSAVFSAVFRAVGATLSAADAAMFVGIEPFDAGTLALWTIIEQQYRGPNLGERLVAMFADAAGHAELQRWLLSRFVGDAVGDAAAQLATPANDRETHAEAQARASADARNRYKRAIAAVAQSDQARTYCEAVALADRLEIARQRYEAARAEQARVEAAKRAEAARIEAAKRDAEEYEAELRAELAKLGAGANSEAERIRAVVALRRRAQKSKVTAVRVNGGLYDVRSLGINNMSLDEAKRWSAVLDRAEAEASAS